MRQRLRARRPFSFCVSRRRMQLKIDPVRRQALNECLFKNRTDPVQQIATSRPAPSHT